MKGKKLNKLETVSGKVQAHGISGFRNININPRVFDTAE